MRASCRCPMRQQALHRAATRLRPSTRRRGVHLHGRCFRNSSDRSRACFAAAALPHNDREARRTKGAENGRVVPPHTSRRNYWAGIFVTSYMLPASVSWWNGDNHLLPFFCQIVVAKTFPACFLPSQVASCVAAYVMTTVSLSSHI
jgi:hypothetical protein